MHKFANDILPHHQPHGALVHMSKSAMTVGSLRVGGISMHACSNSFIFETYIDVPSFAFFTENHSSVAESHRFFRAARL